MSVKLLILLCSTLIVVHGQDTWPRVRAENCRPTSSCCVWSVPEDGNTTDSVTPRGFRATTLPNPELMLTNPHPCVTATATDTVQSVSVAVELLTLNAGSRLCIVVNNAINNRACGSGQVRYCDKVTQTALNITFYCDAGCDQSDVSFFYRIDLSSSLRDEEYYCDNAVDYPSSLIQLIPPEEVTVQSTVPDGGHQILSSSLVLLATVIMALSFGLINLFV